MDVVVIIIGFFLLLVSIVNLLKPSMNVLFVFSSMSAGFEH